MRRIRTSHKTIRGRPVGKWITPWRRRSRVARFIFLNSSADQGTSCCARRRSDRGTANSSRRCPANNCTSGSTVTRAGAGWRIT